MQFRDREEQCLSRAWAAPRVARHPCSPDRGLRTMNDPLTQQIRDALTARMDSVAPESAARLRAHDYRPRRHRLPVVPAISTGAAACGAIAITLILMLSSGTTTAFAGWTSTPSPASAGAVAAARKACGGMPASGVLASEARGPFTAITFVRDDEPTQCVVKGSTQIVSLSTKYPTKLYESVPSGKAMEPVITQQVFGKTKTRIRALEDASVNEPNAGLQLFARRKELEKILALKGRARTQALKAYKAKVRAQAKVYNKRYAVYAKREQAQEKEIAGAMTGPGSLSAAIGLTGRDVTGVTFILADGDRVQATVEHGWYVAWWPGASRPGGGNAVRVQVTTASSTRSSALPQQPLVDVSYSLPVKGCVVGDACSVMVPVLLTPGVPRFLTEHYAIFHELPPASPSSEPKTVKLMIDRFTDSGQFLGSPVEETMMGRGFTLGLDASQVRGVQLEHGNSAWLIPGSEGICMVFIQHGGGGGSCGPGLGSLKRGGFMTGGGSSITGGSTYSIEGFVPNGNATVAIKLRSGAIKHVAVKDNAVVATFHTQIVSISFLNTAGKRVTDQESSPRHDSTPGVDRTRHRVGR
jgi:hypothetical protein